MRNPPTNRQQAVLDTLSRLIREHVRVPTIVELAADLGLSGPTVHQHLKALEKKGYVRRKPGSPRSLEVVGASPVGDACDCTRVPVVGVVAGGPAILAVEQPLGYVSVNRRSAAGETLFALRVRGDSMVGAGILDGDLVIVRQQQTADDGDIVVALVGEEATVKRLKRRNGAVDLVPENPGMAAITVSPEDLRIQGKVVAVERIVTEDGGP
jgi:repressor LexA